MAGGMKVPVTVDKDSATKQLNDWLQEQNNKEIEIGIDPSPFKQLADQTLAIGQAFEDLKSPPSLEELKQRAEDADKAFIKAREETAAFALSLKALGADADPAWISAYKSRLKELNENLNRNQQAAAAAAGAVEQSQDDLKSKFNEARAWIGDVGDAFGKLGKTLFGLTDAEAAAGDKALYMASKGMALGEAFGPLGMVIGGLAGVALALFTSGMEAAAAATQKMVDAGLRDLNNKRQQIELTRKATEATIDYNTAVAAAGKVEIGNVLTLLTAEKNLFDERTKWNREQLKQIEDYRTTELTKAKANAASEGSIATEKRIAEINAYADKFKLQNEAAIKNEEEAAQLRLLSNAHLKGGEAIEDEIASLNKQRHALELIGHDKSIKELKVDYDLAKSATDKALDAVTNLKDEIANKKGSGGGFIDTFQGFYDQLVTLPRLVEEAKKAIGLEGEAKGALTTKEKAPKKAPGLTIEEFNRQQAQEVQDERNKDLEKWADEQLKIMEDEKKAAAEVEKEWNKTLENYEIDKNKRLYDQALAASLAKIELAKEQHAEETRIAEEAAKKQQQQFDETTAYYTSTINDYLMPMVNEVTGQLYKNIEEGNKAFEGFGSAAKKGIAEALKALGKQFAVQAISEAAAGLASLALGPFGGVSAGMHFAAAAGYGAAALAAGVGAAAVTSTIPKEGTTPAPSPDKGGAGFSGGPLGNGRTPFTTEQKTPLVINVSGVPFGAMSYRELVAIGGRVNAASEAHNQSGSYPE